MAKRQHPENNMELSTLTAAILNGQLKDLPKSVNLNLEKASAADYQALLQLVRFRSFGHQVLQTEPQQSEIQSVRGLVNSGRFTEARGIAKKMDSNDPEVRVELARTHVFLGSFDQVRALLAPVLADALIAASTRGVAAQLLGHAEMEMGDLTEATASFESAQMLAKSSGNDLGHISANLFLSRVRAFQGEFKEAYHYLSLAREDIVRLGSFRWLLAYYRHLSHVYFLASDQSCVASAHVGVLLARALKDQLFEYRGILEIVLMTRKFGLSLELDVIAEKMRIFAANSESDLRLWMAVVFGDAAPHTFSARQFLKESGVIKSGLNVKLVPDLKEAIFWIYDRRVQTLIDLKSSEFFAIPPEGPQGKMISLLQRRPNGVETAELFEKVWNLKWSQERHQNVLDVTIHRLNKTSKILKILRENGKMRLSSEGLLL